MFAVRTQKAAWTPMTVASVGNVGVVMSDKTGTLTDNGQGGLRKK